MAWWVMHCPLLMDSPMPGSSSIPFIQRLEKSKWRIELLSAVRQALNRWQNYLVNPCSVQIPGGSIGIGYVDNLNSHNHARYTILPPDVFDWLMNIRPGYLVSRTRDRCLTELYLPCRFARQFGYDKLLVGNPRPDL